MARIVLTTWGSYGDLNPYLGLALALRVRGHEPVLATMEAYRQQVEGAGIAFHPVRPDVYERDTATIRRIMDPMRGSETIFREILVPSLRDSYADLLAATEGADLLVTHPVALAGPLVAAKRGLPWLSAVLAPMSFFSEYDLPVFPPFPWTARVRGMRRLSRALIALARASTRPWLRPVHAFRAELGLPPGGDPVFEGQFSPYGTLALFSRVLAEPQPDWPARVTVTGQVVYDGTAGESLSTELARFLEVRDPPVVFTLGSSAVWLGDMARRFYAASAEAAARLGRRAVLVVGRHPENLPAQLPDGVIAVKSAPFSALFPRAAAIVHQGGIGTLGQALRAGRPQLVVPFANDQPDNAARVERLGVARILRPRRYTAARAAATLGALLVGDPPRRADTVGRAVRSEPGAASACDAIEALLVGVT